MLLPKVSSLIMFALAILFGSTSARAVRIRCKYSGEKAICVWYVIFSVVVRATCSTWNRRTWSRGGQRVCRHYVDYITTYCIPNENKAAVSSFSFGSTWSGTIRLYVSACAARILNSVVCLILLSSSAIPFRLSHVASLHSDFHSFA